MGFHLTRFSSYLLDNLPDFDQDTHMDKSAVNKGRISGSPEILPINKITIFVKMTVD